MKKRILAIICVFVLLQQQAFASILGTDIFGWSHEIATGTKLYRNAYMSEQSGVGQQVEYYAEYTPNESVVPVIAWGKEMWGSVTISKAENYMKENNVVPLIGVNASYFSYKTGLPMGHVISDGKIVSKDTETYQSIGFMQDGSAFIAPLSITTTLHYGEKEVDIAHINKFNQELMDIINLYTPEFAEHNHNDFLSLNLILGDIDGELAVGKELSCVVEEKFNYQGPLKIPKDKMILTVNEIARPELYEALMSLNVGDKITISSTATGSEKWEDAVSALGSVGETLIEKGEMKDEFSNGATSRTAVGIKADGTIIFYVIDGRQKPYSYGVKVKTLAKRMEELGCVDAINLDGGGSTVISGVYPGCDVNAIINSPSEDNASGVSNYIFLKNAATPTNKAEKLFLYPFSQNYLSGYSEEVTVTATDSEYYSANIPENIEYQVLGTESKIENNVLTAIGDGEFSVTLSGGNAMGSATYHVYKTPTNIDVYNSNNKIISDLKLRKGDSVNLKLTAQRGYIELKSTFDCFKISVPQEIGYMDGNKLVITAEDGEGTMIISAGEYSKEIPISVICDNPFSDTNKHWAKVMINGVYEKGIVNGINYDGKLVFFPDSNITREEFAVIICNFMGIDVSQFKNSSLSGFTDEKQISDWAKPYVAAAVESGVFTGKSLGNALAFAPKDTLKRAEIMTVLGRITEDDGEDFDLSFTDKKDIPDWAFDYIKKMVGMGYVSGYLDNTVRPNGDVSRAEAATIIYKMIIN